MSYTVQITTGRYSDSQAGLEIALHSRAELSTDTIAAVVNVLEEDE